MYFTLSDDQCNGIERSIFDYLASIFRMFSRISILVESEMYPKFLECSSQVTKSTSRISRNNRASSLKVYILSQFNEYCLNSSFMEYLKYREIFCEGQG
jgi:hypothetical protein